jgi:hypothetical protein
MNSLNYNTKKRIYNNSYVFPKNKYLIKNLEYRYSPHFKKYNEYDFIEFNGNTLIFILISLQKVHEAKSAIKISSIDSSITFKITNSIVTP